MTPSLGQGGCIALEVSLNRKQTLLHPELLLPDPAATDVITPYNGLLLFVSSEADISLLFSVGCIQQQAY